MTHKELIDLIVSDKDIKDACRNITRNRDADELYQQLIFQLLETPEDVLLNAYNKGYLKYYIVRFAVNLNKVNIRQNGRYVHVILETTDEPYNYDIDENATGLQRKINSLPEFEQRLLLEYLKNGSYRKLEAVTGIPYRTLGRNIKTIKDKLK